MKTYKIFKNPTGQYEAVKQGWSWPAFLFGGIWACVKKIWGLGIGIFVVFIILNLIAGDNQAMGSLISALGFGVGIVLGLQGNKLREGNLKNAAIKKHLKSFRPITRKLLSHNTFPNTKNKSDS